MNSNECICIQNANSIDIYIFEQFLKGEDIIGLLLDIKLKSYHLQEAAGSDAGTNTEDVLIQKEAG